MIPSIPGLLVAAAIFAIGYALRAPITIGLFISLPLGSTAWATLPALGGSSPLIYTLFAAMLLGATAFRRDIVHEVSRVFSASGTPWIVLVLTCYAIVSSVVFPRLFAGYTSAFIPIRGYITEVPLAPSAGNITQSAYFTLGSLTFLALSVLLLQEKKLAMVKKGFFAFVIVNVGLGILDLAGKMAGAGDVLLPIRSASYAFLTEAVEAGFWRINGGFSEASGFAGASLACLGFCYAYWRVSKSTLAFGLSIVTLLLLLFSTSSTAYGGLAVLLLAPLAVLVGSVFRNRFSKDEALLAGMIAIIVVGVMAIIIYDARVFDPVVNLFDRTVLDKSNSESGKERGYWNQRSMENVVDTGGLGIGLGSSRSSSWAISVASQLGIIGSIAMGALLVIILRGLGGLRQTRDNMEVFALASGARGCAVAGLLAATIGGGMADPGILFMVSLATIAACRHHVQAESAAPAAEATEKDTARRRRTRRAYS
jgi:hypothetical protein